MDTLTFVSSLTEALAWPVAAVVLVLFLRREIGLMLPLLKRIKAGPLEAEFERELKELRTTTDAELPKVAPSAETQSEATLLVKLAELNPRSAVLEAWQRVETAARRVPTRRALNLTPAQEQSPVAVARALSAKGLISTEEYTLFHDLRALRNQAAHAHDFSPTGEAALNYVALSSRLLMTLERAASGG